MGIPGSGKSTLTRALFPDHKFVSTDAIRQELYGDDPYSHDRNAVVFDTFHNRIDEYLSFGCSVIADATNMRRSDRDTLKAIAALIQFRPAAKTHAMVFTNVRQAVVRNLERQNTNPRWFVPIDAMKEFISKYETMLMEIRSEEFDTITYISRTA